MSLNKVLLIGRLGKDPEKRFMLSGDVIVNFSLATNENWKDKSGQKQERTEWHNITMFGKLAEIAATYLKKGQQVYLEGKISSRKYMGRDNIERICHDIICDQMVMLGSKGSNSTTSFDSPPPLGNITPPPSEPLLNTPISPSVSPSAPTKQLLEEKNIDIGEIDSDVPF
ncbi:MAG: single-stranded DNA-binding protein [Neisseriaceae bacterium]|nr:MAG: single-stranded DNA-binding protein [Neisseriaceae bacterium]